MNQDPARTNKGTGKSLPNKPPGPSLSRGFAAQLRCLSALMVRDMLLHYGRGNLGFLWVLIEPMLLTVGVIIIWTSIKGDREHGVEMIAFVITGYVPLTLWRHLTNASIFGLRRSVGLLYHRNLSALDTFFAKMLLEFAGATAAFIVIVTILLTLGLIQPIHDITLVVAGWFAMGALAFGSALIICSLTELSEVWERFIGPYQYLMLPISGCFFMVEWLPTMGKKLAWYNPQVHCFEAVRAGFFGDHITTQFDIWYPFVWALFLVAIGLWMLDKARDRVHYG